MRNEGHLEEGPYHAGNVAALVAAQEVPLADHQGVHGNPHVTIATDIIHVSTSKPHPQYVSLSLFSPVQYSVALDLTEWL